MVRNDSEQISTKLGITSSPFKRNELEMSFDNTFKQSRFDEVRQAPLMCGLGAADHQQWNNDFQLQIRQSNRELIDLVVFPDLQFDFGNSKSEFNTQSENFENLLASKEKAKNHRPSPEDFIKGDWLLKTPAAFLPEGNNTLGLDYILQKHTGDAKTSVDKPEQGVFNTNDPELLKQILKVAIITHVAKTTVTMGDGEKRTVYQAIFTPNGECAFCNNGEPIGYVRYKGGAKVPAYFVNVVINENGVIMNAYPTNEPLTSKT
jgi:hypothetical protein